MRLSRRGLGLLYCVIASLLVFPASGCTTRVENLPSKIVRPQPLRQKEIVVKDVPYAAVSAAQKLDVYVPAADKKNSPHPVIVWIHGGAWMTGDKALVPNSPQLAAVLDHYYALVSINYRLSGEVESAIQIIYDVKAATRWVRANAAKYNLDPDNIGVWGGSAGGHLSCLLGTSGGVKELEDLSLGSPDESSRVQAVVDWYGPTDLAQESMLSADTNNVLGQLLGDSPQEKLAAAVAASPVTYISPDDPPFFIQHGTNDQTVPMAQSQELYDRLVPVIGQDKVVLEFLPAGHGGPVFSTPENIDKIISFFDRYLKG